tara:strand:- start:1334 stop:1645 length:312 start_codon:yes stop_codon:yes gene_type:complete
VLYRKNKKQKSMSKNKDPFPIRQLVEEIASEKTLFADGLDDAIIGVVERSGFNETIILYDTNKIIELLEADGMSNEEATEYFQYNILGSYMGEGTPAFATLLK